MRLFCTLSGAFIPYVLGCGVLKFRGLCCLYRERVILTAFAFVIKHVSDASSYHTVSANFKYRLAVQRSCANQVSWCSASFLQNWCFIIQEDQATLVTVILTEGRYGTIRLCYPIRVSSLAEQHDCATNQLVEYHPFVLTFTPNQRIKLLA